MGDQSDADVSGTEDFRDLRQALARVTSTHAEDWYLVFKARHGLEVCFSAARACHGEGSVVTQLLTCCTAVAPIMAAGLAPRYGEISARTLSLDPSCLELPGDVRAVVDLHPFGMIDQVSDLALRDAAHAAGALLVEDCAHCVGRMSTDVSGVPLADVSVHSFGVEKLIPKTHFGGAVWLNPDMADGNLRKRLVEAFEALPAMPRDLDEATQHYLNQIRVMNRLPSNLAHSMRARLERKGTFEPAVSDAELAGAVSHEPMLPSTWVARRALEGLKDLDENLSGRRAGVAAYAQGLADVGPSVETPASSYADQPLMRFPLVLEGEGKADELVGKLRAAGVWCDSWGRPLLYPGPSDPAAFGLGPGLEVPPVTRRCSQGIVCLPTDLGPERTREVVDMVRS